MRLKDLIPKELIKFAKTQNDIEALSNFGHMKLAKQNIAPKTAQAAYRPAVELKSGEVLWHKDAKVHADAITLQPQVKKTGHFDYASVISTGGVGPDGHYYRDSIFGDAIIDIEYIGIKNVTTTERRKI